MYDTYLQFRCEWPREDRLLSLSVSSPLPLRQPRSRPTHCCCCHLKFGFVLLSWTTAIFNCFGRCACTYRQVKLLRSCACIVVSRRCLCRTVWFHRHNFAYTTPHFARVCSNLLDVIHVAIMHNDILCPFPISLYCHTCFVFVLDASDVC